MNFFVLNSQTSMNKIHREFHVALIKKKYFIHMKKNTTLFAIILGVLFLSATNGKRITRQEYIQAYHKIAQDKMKKHGIPASITLAQGILESDCGNSHLAQKANNHFGIKCHDWTGAKIHYDDDTKNECFRKYKKAEDSFEDHSEFLTGRSRYASLFDLKPTDYKGWARGLKKAGYATDPKYADRLIKIIEEEELYKYDRDSKVSKGGVSAKENVAKPGILRPVFYNNNVRYVLAKEGETLTSLSSEFGMRAWELPYYNDLPKGSALVAGEKVYVRPKRSKSARNVKFHKVEAGETMHSVSQLYGVKLNSLYRKNRMSKDMNPAVGEVLFLRYKKPKTLQK